jgi:hypothetical protein
MVTESESTRSAMLINTPTCGLTVRKIGSSPKSQPQVAQLDQGVAVDQCSGTGVPGTQ